MVRLIPVTMRNGKIEYAEDAPTHCPAGHQGLAPKWGPCPVCGFSMRYWQCRTASCGAETWDDEHVHRRPVS